MYQPPKDSFDHQVDQLLVENKSESAIIITKTNIPNLENLGYFGDQDEAHLIYNFTLPPLLINTLLQVTQQQALDDDDAINKYEKHISIFGIA